MIVLYIIIIPFLLYMHVKFSSQVIIVKTVLAFMLRKKFQHTLKIHTIMELVTPRFHIFIVFIF